MSTSNVDLSESRGPAILGAILSTYCVAIVVLCLRATSRIISRVGFWIDDWLVLAGTAIHTVVIGLFIQSVQLGAGRHIQTVNPAVFVSVEIYFYITEIIFAWGLGLVKCSVLAFYWRIFAVSPSIRRPIWIMVAAVIAWAIAATFATAFQCNPPTKLWKPSTPGVCVSKFNVFLGTSIPEIVTDFIILAMPIPYIWRLHANDKQKVSLTGLFLLGGFACISSILRLWAFMTRDYSSPDLTWTTADSIIWSCVEGNVAIISACLPSLRPILKFIHGSWTQRASGYKTPEEGLIGSDTRQSGQKRSRSSSYPLASLGK